MCLTPIRVKNRLVACGHCIECKIQYSSTWAYRIALESSLYEHNCFITLTYNEDNRPKDDHLSKRDLQLFMKRLRKHFNNDKVRFFSTGEYGNKKGRPHYHIILFNVKFDDLFFWCMDNKKQKLFRSPTLEKLWTKGFSSVAELTIDSAKYCAKYLQKVPDDGRPKPFILMSKKPGIGLGAFKEKWIDSDKLYFQGQTIRIPRYFLDKAEDRQAVEELKLRRDKNDIALQYFDDNGFNLDLYNKYIDSRISKFETNFNLQDIKDCDGKKAQLKKKIEKIKEKRQNYLKLILTRTEESTIINDDHITMRKSH